MPSGGDCRRSRPAGASGRAPVAASGRCRAHSRTCSPGVQDTPRHAGRSGSTTPTRPCGGGRERRSGHSRTPRPLPKPSGTRRHARRSRPGPSTRPPAPGVAASYPSCLPPVSQPPAFRPVLPRNHHSAQEHTITDPIFTTTVIPTFLSPNRVLSSPTPQFPPP